MSADGLPDWMTVGAEVIQVQDRRYYTSIVKRGTVARILARDIVVVDADDKELLRFRRADYDQKDDHFRRRANDYAYADSVYLYRADDPKAAAIERRALIVGGISSLAAAASTLQQNPNSIDEAMAISLDVIAETATLLAALIREGQ
ncbi:Uncharacterised protein [Mycobacteroides abscessus subsp. massiliense]|uniref:hypothetical protein n=1 Tax=Mycobacteroides abscessus TaxID=36809 RepID=UPI0009A732AF|nr:hypothetical protein [Mycobacteroides abscessus]SKM81550.1 Uncharacterised protein [Mycobacteroides abscessus subsp. massiliense]SKM98189.1 Uncharacterised protein [Mycobacteroides abscessus subsp. massiliense]SKN76890.1 Uncharacterised protein [Mycobacteroides abscessus subsp. massiliense]SKN96213.1 Uncharacterised protein [Mycobacteroides abscessus subsp. massiliense]SKO21696.1 Uncharacterised protein [Mycobacteroides abscessus subsp. massiliense]